MLKQIRYFQAVVQTGSFSEAAEQCHISQSAVSQQISALERDLGFSLLERKNRRFNLTPAGEYFYRKSLILLADLDRICAESMKLARGDSAVLHIGCLRSYTGHELYGALSAFSEKYPQVTVQIHSGDHEDLYHLLRSGQVDLVLSDQRRAFADAYVNLVLATRPCVIEVPTSSPLAALECVDPSELKNCPCVLVSAQDQRENEWDYYHHIIGFPGDVLYADNLEEARMLVLSRRGFMPSDGEGPVSDMPLTRVPLVRGDTPILRKYCAFWKKDNSGFYVESFGEMLAAQFKL